MNTNHFVVILEQQGQPANVVGPFPTANDGIHWGFTRGGYSASVWKVMSPEDYDITLHRKINQALKSEDL